MTIIELPIPFGQGDLISPFVIYIYSILSVHLENSIYCSSSFAHHYLCCPPLPPVKYPPLFFRLSFAPVLCCFFFSHLTNFFLTYISNLPIRPEAHWEDTLSVVFLQHPYFRKQGLIHSCQVHERNEGSLVLMKDHAENNSSKQTVEYISVNCSFSSRSFPH